MKIAMRLDKSQVSSFVKYNTPGRSYFDVHKAIMAGYTDVETMIVGAAGGRSGQANSSSSTYGSYSDGGGGGGMIRGKTKLASINPTLDGSVYAGGITYVQVGALGSNAPTSGNNQPAAAGGNGGSSYWGTFPSAEGGYGGQGDEWYVDSTTQFNNSHQGGEGRSNGSILGDPNGSGGANGGNGASYYRDVSSSPAYVSQSVGTAAQNGGHENGTGIVLSGGCGGGGGVGRTKPVTSDVGRAGGTGCNGSVYSAPGGPPVGTSPYTGGGGGGGANVGPYTGSNEYYGCADPVPASNRFGQGCVIIKLT